MKVDGIYGSKTKAQLNKDYKVYKSTDDVNNTDTTGTNNGGNNPNTQGVATNIDIEYVGPVTISNVPSDILKQITSIGVGFIPIIGDVKDVQEVLTGYDVVTGETLTWTDRGITFVCMFVPVVNGKAVREVIQHADEGVELIEGAIKSSDELIEGAAETKPKWWHPNYVDNLNTTQTILGVKQAGKGLSALGSATEEAAMNAGLAWVGEGYKTITDKAGNIIGYSSSDGMRAFRIQYKPKEGMWRANFTQNYQYINGQGATTVKELKNVHIDILDK